MAIGCMEVIFLSSSDARVQDPESRGGHARVHILLKGISPRHLDHGALTPD